jgi:DNA primase
MMGSALSERQRWLLVERFRDVTLMLDGDRAGRQASIAIAARLGQDCPVSTVRLSENAQPDQLSSQCLQEILAEKGGSPQTHKPVDHQLPPLNGATLRQRRFRA